MADHPSESQWTPKCLKGSASCFRPCRATPLSVAFEVVQAASPAIFIIIMAAISPSEFSVLIPLMADSPMAHMLPPMIPMEEMT